MANHPIEAGLFHLRAKIASLSRLGKARPGGVENGRMAMDQGLAFD